MTILLAIGETTMTKLLRKHLYQGLPDLETLDEEVLHRKFLLEMVEMYSPSMLVLHDALLPSESDEQERDQEMLQIIRHLRMQYDQNIRIVYLCFRDKKDPFLGQLVGLGVYDIFHTVRLDTTKFINQLSHPPKFANVSRLGVNDVSVDLIAEDYHEEAKRNEKQTENETSVPTQQVEVVVQEEGLVESLIVDIPGQYTDLIEHDVAESVEVEKKLTRSKRVKSTPVDEEEEEHVPRRRNRTKTKPMIDQEPVVKTIVKEVEKLRLIGTVIISVAGMRGHLGTTRTALSIARALSKDNERVAVVELNHSKDFDRIHAYLESSAYFLLDEPMFRHEGIDHFKHHPDLKLSDILAEYTYVILDVGSLENNSYLEEFKRGHVRFVLTSSAEWKYGWIDELLTGCPGAEKFTYLIADQSDEKFNKLKEEFVFLSFEHVRLGEDMYILSDEEQTQWLSLLKNYLVGGKTNLTPKVSRGKLFAFVGLAAATIAIAFAFGLR